MDDKEYYSMMNRTSRFVINDTLRKLKDKKGGAGTKTGNAQVKSHSDDSYKTLESRQGKADAEMLLEKRPD